MVTLQVRPKQGAIQESSSNMLGSLEALKKPFLVYPEEHMVQDNQARYVDYRFSDSQFSEIEILHLTDIQHGHPHCKEARVKEHLDWLLRDPKTRKTVNNRFFVLGGDCIDASHAMSKGYGLGQKEPQIQVYNFCKLLAPYRHRCLGFVGGNHERRAQPMFGDLGRMIAYLLGIPYSPGKQFINLYFGNWAPFKIGLYHGASGGQTKGAIANQVYKWMSQADCHLYLLGHLHQAMVIPDNREFHDLVNSRIDNEKIIGAMSTSFLDYYGTYSEVAGYRNPGKSLMARAIVEASGKWEVTLR